MKGVKHTRAIYSNSIVHLYKYKHFSTTTHMYLQLFYIQQYTIFQLNK